MPSKRKAGEEGRGWASAVTLQTDLRYALVLLGEGGRPRGRQGP